MKCIFFNIETIVKKTVFLFIAISTTLFCQITDPSYKWYPVTELIEKANKLKTGDILVLSKQHTILQSQGHVAVINENMKIVEFPSFSIGYAESPIFAWYDEKRKVSVFRLKNIDDNFKNALFKEIDKTTTKTYGLTFNKNFDKRLYCSQFVYLVFKRAEIDVGRDVDLDSNGGKVVLPFDIMRSPLLENVDLDE